MKIYKVHFTREHDTGEEDYEEISSVYETNNLSECIEKANNFIVKYLKANEHVTYMYINTVWECVYEDDGDES